MADFREAVLRGQPDDKGLYFPATIPQFTARFFEDFRELPNEQIAFEVIQPYVGDSIGVDALLNICKESVDLPFPLVPVGERISALELFHGPTLAFKDVGARFMSRCLGYFSGEIVRKAVVVVATSGDTGGAVAAGFHGIEGVDVVILFPKGKVSRVQELQLTTLGDNVITLEVRGTFDDCQSLAKQALADGSLRDDLFITSANSINIARWLPQQFYYLFALKQCNYSEPIFSVPSGNFGNIAAGLLANASGMPAGGFIAACNANDVVPEYLRTGRYKPRRSVSTLSNAMDVGDPSNFVRIQAIFNGEIAALRQKLSAVSVNDDETAETMRFVHERYGYILDPHGAVGYKALADRLSGTEADTAGIFLETAHPIKFDTVGPILGIEIPVPGTVATLFQKKPVKTEIDADYETVKEVIRARI